MQGKATALIYHRPIIFVPSHAPVLYVQSPDRQARRGVGQSRVDDQRWPIGAGAAEEPSSLHIDADQFAEGDLLSGQDRFDLVSVKAAGAQDGISDYPFHAKALQLFGAR